MFQRSLEQRREEELRDKPAERPGDDSYPSQEEPSEEKDVFETCSEFSMSCSSKKLTKYFERRKMGREEIDLHVAMQWEEKRGIET